MKAGLTMLLLTLAALGCRYDTVEPQKPFDCNAQAVTYTSHVKAILDQHCATVGCHSGINPSGIMLDTYQAAKLDFEFGNSMCTINHNALCKPMPYPAGTPKLPDSVIAILTCWHDNGFPN